MEFSASGPAAIPILLLGMAIPLIIFVVIPILIIRSVIKAFKNNMMSGFSFSELRNLTSQFPKGTNWQGLAAEWDIKVDPTTKKITLKRKSGISPGTESNSPQEIQIDSLAQLPETLKRLMPQQKTGQNTLTSEGIEFTSNETKAPVSASSTINRPQTIHDNQGNTPQNFELIQTIKKVALIILILWLFYSFKNYFI